MRGIVRALVVSVAVLSFRTPFVLSAISTVRTGMDWNINHLCTNRQDALSLEFTADATLPLKILTQLISQLVFAGVLIDIQLFLCPVPFQRFPQCRLAAASLPRLHDDP